MPMIVFEGDAQEAREEAYACLDALDAAPRGDRPVLVLKAIRADPTLIDGYLAAADEAPQGTTEAAIAWLAARELARREAGARLDADLGALWSNLHARPYLRACAGYAACCFDRREYDAAIAQCRRLLILDAFDPLEAAPLLGASLLLAGDRFGYEALREQSADDDRPQWLYVDAFHAATTKLPAPVRNSRLDRAIKSNRYVPGCLISAQPDTEGIEHYAPGSDEEALVIGASRPGRLWRTRPEAVSVLIRRVNAQRD